MSKLKLIWLKNFMSIEDALITFDETNIISLCGYNDSGKSAIIRAIEIVCEDAYPTEQVKYIQDGKDYSCIGLEFDDHVTVLKYKYASGSTRWLMTKDIVEGDKTEERVLFDNQLANGTFSRVDGVPDIIKKYLGTFKEENTGESLNIRRSSNKLLLVDTTGGENYKIINGYLQGEQLAWATKKAQEAVNETQRTMVNKGTRLAELEQTLETSQPIPVELESDLSIKSAELRQLQGKISILSRIVEVSQRLDNIVVPPEVQYVDTTKLGLLSELKSSLEIQQRPIPPEVAVINTDKLNLLVAIKDALSKVNSTVLYPEVQILDFTRLDWLSKMYDQCDKVSKLNAEYQGTSENYDKLRADLEATASQNGWKICKNCGTVVE